MRVLSDRTMLILLAIGVGLILAACSALCITEPDKIADWARRRYSKSSKFTQSLPLARMVTKEWYPTYLRFTGLFGVLLVVWWYYAVFTRLTSSQ